MHVGYSSRFCVCVCVCVSVCVLARLLAQIDLRNTLTFQHNIRVTCYLYSKIIIIIIPSCNSLERESLHFLYNCHVDMLPMVFK